MPSEQLPHRLSFNFPDDPALLGLLGDEANRPPRPAGRRRAADHGDDRALVGVVQDGRRLGPRLVCQRGLDTAIDETPADASHLAPVGADGLRDVQERPALVEQFEDPNTPPISLAKSAEPLDVLEALSVDSLELQAGETLALGLHPVR